MRSRTGLLKLASFTKASLVIAPTCPSSDLSVGVYAINPTRSFYGGTHGRDLSQ
jgi:hypothetical protein